MCGGLIDPLSETRGRCNGNILNSADGTYCECHELCQSDSACTSFSYGDGSQTTYNCYTHSWHLGDIDDAYDFSSNNYHCYDAGTFQ